MFRKGKVAVEEKAKIVRAYLAGTISQAEAARQGGIVPSTIGDWARIYEKGEEYLVGKCSQVDVRGKYEIRKRTQFQNWIKVYHTHGDIHSIKQSGGGTSQYDPRGVRPNRQKLHRKRQELRGNGTEIQGQLPAGSHLDSAL